MATATRTLATEGLKPYKIPLGSPSENLVTVTLSFTPDEWSLIREAVSNEASSWRVVRNNADTREAYQAVDARRAKKELGARAREYVGNYIFTGGKAKKYRTIIGPTAVALKYTRLVEAASKITEALKAL